MSGPVRRLWASITEPRHLKVAYFVIYSIALVTGIATLLVPPTSISGELGQPLTIVWAVFLIMGAFGGMLLVFTGWWFAERLCIGLLWAGLAIYFLVVVALHFQSSGSRLTQLGVLLLASAVFYIRWLLIRKYTFEPRRG